MKKKIVGIFVCMLLIITSVSITISSEDNNINIQVLNENDFYENCRCGVTNNAKLRIGLIEEMPITRDLDGTSIKPTIIETPDYFNWMDFEGQDWTTPAKNQNPCGSCWLFSALGALESIINVREGRAELDIDLSEQYVLSCLPRAGNCIGSDPFNAFFYIMNNRSTGNNCNGIIPESCFPYRAIDSDGFNGENYDNDPVPCDEKCENWEDCLIPISDFGKWKADGSPEDIEAIKTQIIQDGPIVTHIVITYYIHGKDNLIDWGVKNKNPDDYYSSSQHFDIVNHCVVIVGWKDDPLINNGGYWICKNSWGTDWGYNGFFNVEYGCLNIDNSLKIWVDYNPDVFANWVPVANAGEIYYGDVGQEIIFNASKSFDHEGEIISYEWDFGDGNHGSGMTTTNMYESQGGYPVTLTVIDNEGNIGNDTTWAFIGRSNDPPSKPTIDGPPNGKKGIAYDYNFSAIDPDGDDIFYSVYWGDMWPEWLGPYNSGEIITLNHTWIEKAEYLICVTAKDVYDFKSDVTSLEVTIPKNKPFGYNLNIFNWLFERFPNAFLILKHLLKLSLERNYENIYLGR
jgi:hypothetical protein